MARNKLSVGDALAVVQQFRGAVEPNTGFYKALVGMEKEIHGML
jgi:hypothetical protein